MVSNKYKEQLAIKKMTNIEELCLGLKNDFFLEIGNNNNWDIAEFPMDFYGSGGGAGGLFILKKDGQETRRISHKKFTSFFSAVLKIIDATTINKGVLTIYPSGKYESSFIWDNEAHLDSLKRGVNSWFSQMIIEAGYRVEDRCNRLSTAWNFETTVIISFRNSISNPILFVTENKSEMTFSLYLEQIYFYVEGDYLAEFNAYSKIRKIDGELVSSDTGFYHLMNEGELKGYYPRWNVASFIIKPNYDTEFNDIKFEWREDLA